MQPFKTKELDSEIQLIYNNELEQIENIYNINDNDDNYIEIEYIDFTLGEIKGRFRLDFIIDPTRNKTNLSLPGTIKFREGVFRAKIVENPTQDLKSAFTIFSN